MQTYEDIRDSLTVDQMRAYVATIPHLNQADAEQYMDKLAMRHRAAALAYAGPNRMAHHERRVSKPGFAGAAQLFSNIFTVEGAKVAAGYWVCEARNLRALGYRGVAVIGALNTAANARRAAFVRSGVVA
jgi:hypothetical protein